MIRLFSRPCAVSVEHSIRRLAGQTITTRSASTASSKPPPSKTRKRLVYAAAGLCAVVAYDRAFNESALVRNARAVYILSLIAADYKLNFDPDHDVDALQARVAERVFNLITRNGGLYIKIGQALAMQAQILPPVFQEKFSKLFDMAPQDEWSAVEKVFVQDFGRTPDEVFDSIEHTAIASASVAQVHVARLKGTGEKVAVKIQHPKIEKQVYWDLLTYRSMMWLYDWLFEIPVYFVAQYISDQMQAETDFETEARNSQNMAQKLAGEKSLVGKVYVPKIYGELQSKRVLTIEWIDGVSMSRREELEQRGYSKRWIMDTMVNLFAAQIFSFGVVHCDPHPGNIIIRPRPGKESELQLVLIDHGLYIYEPDKFRKEYSQLWRHMFTFNTAGIESIVSNWGIAQPEAFASMTMLRTYKAGQARDLYGSVNPEMSEEERKKREAFERQKSAADRFKEFINDTTKMPLELVFLGRNMRIVQGCNQLMGSPVNRVKILGQWASRSLARERGLGLRARVVEWTRHVVFTVVVALSDLSFLAARVRQVVFRHKSGFEDVIEQQMRAMARERFGLDIREGAFEG
ncbi:atypical/ABC1/ABC1-B protein kinase [Myxozyma melibiosi]|uniref:Atypical/ABC1/ABC1-B protein kinase n=1 Tax=Myxozyma melibiosi TaxID=54550 RepID=A0ABR1F4R8_9ASCO